MHILTVKEKVNTSGQPIKYGETLKINAGNLIGVKTGSMYVKEGFLSGKLFLASRHKGDSNNVCELFRTEPLEVNTSMFRRIKAFAQKAKAVI